MYAYVGVYISLSLSIYIYIYIYVCIEREREREKHMGFVAQGPVVFHPAPEIRSAGGGGCRIAAPIGVETSSKPASHYLSNTPILQTWRIMQQIQLAVLDK